MISERGNFKSLQKCLKILAVIRKWSVFGLSSGVLTKEDGKPRSNYHFHLISNLFSAKFCRTFEITSLNKNKKQYKESFRKFLNQAKEKVIINSSFTYKRNQCVSFGFNNSSIKAKNIRYTEKGIFFNLYVNKEYIKDVFLPFYGKHMLMNSLACIACCSYLNLPIATIVESLKKYLFFAILY